MNATQMSTVHAANLVANSGNTAYRVKSINGLIDVSIHLFIDWIVQHNFRHTKKYNIYMSLIYWSLPKHISGD